MPVNAFFFRMCDVVGSSLNTSLCLSMNFFRIEFFVQKKNNEKSAAASSSIQNTVAGTIYAFSHFICSSKQFVALNEKKKK